VAVKAASKSAVKPGMKKVEVKKPVSAPVAVAVAAAPKAPVAAPAAASKKGFGVNEYVVYPTHGVGKILGIEAEKIGDYELKVFVIAFEKDKMILRVPVGRAEAAGLRAISPNDQITRAITTLKGRAKIARGMWSRRAQEYEAKINSGNLVQIAEVVRDLHKNVDQSERSYSERMIYETAMHRLCGEVAASERVDIKIAQDKLLKVLRKQAA
jgi:CarD family transcriptional regulator